MTMWRLINVHPTNRQSQSAYSRSPRRSPNSSVFCDIQPKADSLLPAQKLPIRVRRVSVRNVVVSGMAAF